MAQQAKVLFTKPNDLSSIPQAHVGGGEKRLPQGVTSHCKHTPWHAASPQHQTYILNKWLFFKKRKKVEPEHR